jgi:hypothetical protein
VKRFDPAARPALAVTLACLLLLALGGRHLVAHADDAAHVRAAVELLGR